MKFWVTQQGTNWYVLESETVPETNMPPPARRRALHGSQPTKEKATEKAKQLAKFYNGTYLAVAP